jgi:hypothetical protein
MTSVMHDESKVRWSSAIVAGNKVQMRDGLGLDAICVSLCTTNE